MKDKFKDLDHNFDQQSFAAFTQNNSKILEAQERNRDLHMNKSEFAMKSFQSEAGTSILDVKVVGPNGLTVIDSNS
jgi:hypothetical protein